MAIVREILLYKELRRLIRVSRSLDELQAINLRVKEFHAGLQPKDVWMTQNLEIDYTLKKKELSREQ